LGDYIRENEELVREIENRLGKSIDKCSDNEILVTLDEIVEEKGNVNLDNVV